MAKRDYYEVLGVSREADESQLKKAYRQLALQFHPDRNPGDKKAEERFKEVNEAYSVLSDPEKRAQYDRFGTVGAPGGFDASDLGFGTIFEDLFEGFFGGAPRGGRRTRARRGEDLQYTLEVSLEEAAGGLETRVQIPRHEPCEICHGSGLEPGTKRETCSTCRGQGQVRFSQGFLTVARPCPQCRGQGEVTRHPCRKCRGEGRQRREHLLKIKIPGGVEDGSQLRLVGEGEAGTHGGPVGDLYVVIRIRPHAFFTRHGDDLLCELPLSFPQAALGAEVEVPVLGGFATLKVPAGTQPGQVLRLRGKGIPNVRRRERGDACYQVVLEVPARLTSKQRELLEEYQRASTGESGPLLASFLDRMKNLFGS
ncbi:MAG: molecular chaperone DnaJ [Candidatus Rokubacteria bacterium]|nr:molecular chaperone DnaJ [Candidatus Rokubacteria bacterium]